MKKTRKQKIKKVIIMTLISLLSYGAGLVTKNNPEAVKVIKDVIEIVTPVIVDNNQINDSTLWEKQ